MFTLNIRNAPAPAVGIGSLLRAKTARITVIIRCWQAHLQIHKIPSLSCPNRTHLTVQPLLPPIISRARTTLSQPISRGNGKSEPCVKLALNLRMRGEPRALTKPGRSSRCALRFCDHFISVYFQRSSDHFSAIISAIILFSFVLAPAAIILVRSFWRSFGFSFFFARFARDHFIGRSF